ncbi:hypothetical protein [Photobacterium sp. 53610]|uniref:hypothetical protein n=1 Tax=Photobacterium sp. 53610 TaxID=3102789 RepID=UPI002EDB5086
MCRAAQIKNHDLAHELQHSETPESPHSSSQEGEVAEKLYKSSEPTSESEPESVLAKQDVDGQDGDNGGDDGRLLEEAVGDAKCLSNSLIVEEVVSGHAYQKHLVERNEFDNLDITTKK